MTMSDIAGIVKEISNLPLKEALTFLTVNKIYDFSGKGFGKIKRIIQDKQNEKKYAFVPDKEEARILKQFFGNPQYKEILLLIPHYRYIDLIRTGLLIDYYHQNPNKKNRAAVAQIKKQILRRPNGAKLLKIANLPTTPFFTIILEYLYTHKFKNYSEIQLEEKFDELVSYWEDSSKLVESSESVGDVVSFCKEQISMKKSPFLVLGMKHAAETVENALMELMEKNYLTKKDYTYKMTKQPEGVKPRVELMIFERTPLC